MDVESLKELLEQRFDAQDRTLIRIETQTTKTNGRVTDLERNAARQAAVLAVGIGIIVGTVAVLGFLGMLKKPGEAIVSPSVIVK